MLIQVNFIMVRLKEKEDCFIPMGIFMPDSGEMIKPMVKANIFLETELYMKANGLKILETEKENKYGWMVQYLKGIISKTKKLGKVNLNGQTEMNT